MGEKLTEQVWMQAEETEHQYMREQERRKVTV